MPLVPIFMMTFSDEVSNVQEETSSIANLKSPLKISSLQIPIILDWARGQNMPDYGVFPHGELVGIILFSINRRLLSQTLHNKLFSMENICNGHLFRNQSAEYGTLR